MRLINVSSLHLTEFFGNNIPSYAILSHRWGHDEVRFEAFSSSLSEARKLKGFEKIKHCVRQAERDGLEWCWVDTCCIDKRSSSELSEAINSMYHWYKNAEVCYACLDDVSPVPRTLAALSEPQYWAAFKEWEKEFLKSQWFLRGWTLQELIAPRNLRFFTWGWKEAGGKDQFAGLISRHFQINETILLGKRTVDKANIAQRMRWASGRKTTRIEDIAFCLVGIFDVNMPLLYGEGAKAFIRLQEEIIKRSDDHSIFCWIDRTATRATCRNLFARSPAEFQHCHNIETVFSLESLQAQPFSVTNRGLNISLHLQSLDRDESEYLAGLNCRFVKSYTPLAIRLQRKYPHSNQFFRVEPYRLREINAPSFPMDLSVPEKVVLPIRAYRRMAGFKFNVETAGVTVNSVWPSKGWQKEDNVIRIDAYDSTQQERFTARILIIDQHRQKEKWLVVCSTSLDHV